MFHSMFYSIHLYINYSFMYVCDDLVAVFFVFQGWYIITYGLGIYLLNLFIAFLTPKVNPTILEDSDG